MRLLLLGLLLLPSVFALDIPQPTGFVNDYTDILSSSEELQLEQQLRTIEEQGTVEIAILILPSLEGEDIQMTATDIFREWGVGKEDVNNGVLILVVRDSREIRIEVGYGLEGILTDVTSGLIIRNRIAPSFREGEYGEGLSYAAKDIAALAEEDPSTVSAYEKASSNTGEWIAVAALIFAYAIASLIIKKKGNKKAQKTLSLVTFAVAWIMSTFISSAVLWLVLFFILMINITTTGSAGFFFFPGGRMGGGGGFGGFGGGMSGGGGASGGW